jgi:hypothetical protein
MNREILQLPYGNHNYPYKVKSQDLNCLVSLIMPRFYWGKTKKKLIFLSRVCPLSNKKFHNMCACIESANCEACEAAKNGVPSVLFVGFFIQKTLQKLHRDEYFGGKRNSLSRSFGKVSGTLWTDIK